MDPFRSLILEQVEAILGKEPERENLYDLLRVTSPNLKEANLDIQELRSKSYKSLKLRVHPDKHQNDSRATKVFQNLDSFYDKCVERLLEGDEFGSPKKKRKRGQRDRSSTASTSKPVNFNVRDKWTFLDLKFKKCDAKHIPEQVAYQCINARGAIAHCRDTQCGYSVNESDVPCDAEEAFHRKGAGSKNLEDTDDIKNELMNKGPVVSTSFLLSEVFMNNSDTSFWFDKSLIGKTYPLLIVGWKMTAFGEVWLVQPLTNYGCSEIQKISFGQFGIDDHCIAPLSTFENLHWQSGPYFPLDLSSTPLKWCHEWKSMQCSISSNDLENLGKLLEKDLFEASKAKKKFVICDSTKIAHSRSCYLKTLKWQTGVKSWDITLSLI